MIKVLKYGAFDLLRSRWAFAYFSFYALLSLSLLMLTNDHSQAIISMLNIVVVLTPLLSLIFGIIYFYNSQDFTSLLLAQPLSRLDIFLGQYLGIVMVQFACVFLGMGLPFVITGVLASSVSHSFLSLLTAATFLTFIFTGIAFLIGLKNENRIRGFGLAVMLWLFLAVIYDGLFLLLLSTFRDYPLDHVALIGVLLNPIDLSRVFVMIHLDIAALMGFTGAVFKNVLGNYLGLSVAILVLLGWVLAPLYWMLGRARRRDF